MRILGMLLLAMGCLCWGCAKNAPEPANCPKLYTILPDNFVIDLAAGADVMVNPAMQDFALFCSPALAREALARAGVVGWRVYSLKGDFAELAQPVPGLGQHYRLAAPAWIDDWICD